ncbi:MAG: hypothetical protein N3B21_10470 [Clostridia bacterium]|nr:hypothetical protein [Clostridia bacterium]
MDKTNLKARVDSIKLKDNANPHIKNSDVTLSYIGLLCQGKSDFEAICEMEEDPDFYMDALNIKRIPSAATLRQRMDMAGKKLPETMLIFQVLGKDGMRMATLPLKEAYQDAIDMLKEAGMLEEQKCFKQYSIKDILEQLNNEGDFIN